MFLRIMAALLAIVGLGGIGLALVAGFKSPPAPIVQQAAVAPAPPRPKAHILAASRPLRAGTLLVPDDLATLDVDAGDLPPGSYADSLATRSALRGAMIRRSLAAKEMMVAPDVLNPGDRGFLAAVLGAGMRAVTVAVDQVSGSAGLIWPGDRVDLVLTQALDEKDQPIVRRMSGETVLTNVRVIAVDQQLMQGATAGGNASPGSNRTVTLEASSFDAERISVASRIGKLSLVVRSAVDNEILANTDNATMMPAPPEPPAAIAWSGDVSPALRAQTTGKTGGMIRLHNGAKDEEVKF
jgi:pilus assembly protein CpaB